MKKKNLARCEEMNDCIHIMYIIFSSIDDVSL